MLVVVAVTREEFDENWRRYRSFLLGSAAKLSRDPEDLVQDTAVRLLEHLPRLRADKFGGLAYTVMQHIYTAQQLRCRNRKPHVRWGTGETMKLSVPPPFVEPAIKRILSALRPKTRNALLLIDGLGYSYTEAAEILSTKVRSLDNPMRRARKKIRDEFGITVVTIH